MTISSKRLRLFAQVFPRDKRSRTQPGQKAITNLEESGTSVKTCESIKQFTICRRNYNFKIHLHQILMFKYTLILLVSDKQ